MLTECFSTGMVELSNLTQPFVGMHILLLIEWFPHWAGTLHRGHRMGGFGLLPIYPPMKRKSSKSLKPLRWSLGDEVNPLLSSSIVEIFRGI